MTQRARDLADSLKETDGVANAVAWLERYAGSPFHPHNYDAHTPSGQDGTFVWSSDTAVRTSQSRIDTPRVVSSHNRELVVQMTDHDVYGV
jgi:hypothetical protein